MHLNNIRFAFRALRKNKTYTTINIIGLTVGIAAALLIYRIVSYELSFNTQFANADRIMRVVSVVQTAEEGELHSICTPIPAMDAMENTVTHFEAMSRIKELWCTITIPDATGSVPARKFNFAEGELAFFAEPEFFEIFSLQWLAGDSKTAIAEPGTVVLTKRWAEKCFDTWSAAMGQTVLIDNIIPLVVRGVVDDLPVNCDFPLSFFVSYETVKAHPDYFFHDDDNWGNCSSNNQVYALLRDPGQKNDANALLAKVGEKEYADGSNIQARHHVLQPIAELHYDARYHHSGTHTTEKSRLKLLSIIGILILVMACFNFINLATAQATLRAREVGVRKTLGSGRGQLITQFMSETALLVIGSTILGCALALATAPLLKHVSHVPDSIPMFTNTSVWLFLGAIALFVTLLAGLYPSLALSGFQPVTALKNSFNTTLIGGVSLRKALVVTQFLIAQGLIIGAIITIMQLEYIRSQDLGFNDDLIYTFSFNSDSITIARQQALKQRMLQIPAIEAVTFSSDQPLSGNTWSSNFQFGSRPEDEPYGINLKFCDADYAMTYGIKLLAGKWFAPSDTMREGVVNMTLLRKLGISEPQEVIGQNIRVWGNRIIPITGVIEDFHTHSLRQEHQPLMLISEKRFYWEAGLKMRADNVPGTIAAIQTAFDEVLPEQVFTGRFLDDRIAQFYEDDKRLSATCKAFGVLAVLISCLGLFGLAAHAAAQRVKEIGIRKVLGASVSGILGLLSKDFLKLVVIALLLASPLAWYLMQKWLDNFAYRIDIPWYVFVGAGALAILVAFATVSYQSLRAALANPVASLRSE